MLNLCNLITQQSNTYYYFYSIIDVSKVFQENKMSIETKNIFSRENCGYPWDQVVTQTCIVKYPGNWPLWVSSISKLMKFIFNFLSYIVFHQFGRGKFAKCWFNFKLQPIFDLALAESKPDTRYKIVKIDSKIIISSH